MASIDYGKLDWRAVEKELAGAPYNNSEFARAVASESFHILKWRRKLYEQAIDKLAKQASEYNAILREAFNASYDAQLLKAAMAWKYEPARKGGVPVRFVNAVSDITVNLDARRRIHSVSFQDRNSEGIYGTFTDPDFGCPWGWARTLQAAQPRHPFVMGEYLIEENSCPAPSQPDQERGAYTAHNPTLTRNLALITWHSGGLQAIDIEDPAQMEQAGWYSPTPLEAVATEDPALSGGTNKVVMWSFPIVKDGLIYVVDVRNGLYILRYKGPFANEVSRTRFLEGNSNFGDALRFERP